MANQPNATLCAHSGAVKISRGELFSIPTPPRTSSFTPVAHAQLIDLIEHQLECRGYGIQSAEYAVQDGKLDGRSLAGAKLFATMILKATRSDFAFALGLRAANDKSMAIGLVAGCKVFVCDNMALSGDEEILWRKHTSGLYIRQLVPAGVDKAIARLANFEVQVARLKETLISDVQAKALMFDAVVGVKNGTPSYLPQAFLPKVSKAYFEPPHKEFEPRTQWSLQNAFTEVYRTEYAAKPHLLLESTQALGLHFGL